MISQRRFLCNNLHIEDITRKAPCSEQHGADRDSPHNRSYGMQKPKARIGQSVTVAFITIRDFLFMPFSSGTK